MNNFIDKPRRDTYIFSQPVLRMFIGLRNSSMRISPGWIGESLSSILILLNKKHIGINVISNNRQFPHFRRFLAAKQNKCANGLWCGYYVDLLHHLIIFQDDCLAERVNLTKLQRHLKSPTSFEQQVEYFGAVFLKTFCRIFFQFLFLRRSLSS